MSVPTSRELQKRWSQAVKAACRRRGMRFVSEEGFTVDDVYITSLAPSVSATAEVMKISWAIDIKPLALDDILWSTPQGE